VAAAEVLQDLLLVVAIEVVAAEVVAEEIN
jgi:hypothetical protein